MRRSSLVVVLISLLCGRAEASLRQAIADSQAKLCSWYVEYESTMQDGKYVHRVVAAIGPDRLYHWGSHGTTSYGWREDPYQQRLIINGPNAVIEFPYARSFHSFEISPTDPLPGTAEQELIFTALGLWPFDQRPPPRLESGAPADLREIAASTDYQEKGDVLDYPHHDCLWFNTTHGAVLAAREIYDPATGRRLQRIELGEWREVKPGVFFPMRWRNIVDDTGVDATIRVLDVHLGKDVDPKLFNFTPRPGSLKFSEDGQFQQAASGGEDYLDGLVAWVQRQTPAKKASDEAAIEWSICGAAAIFFGIMAIKGIMRLTPK